MKAPELTKLAIDWLKDEYPNSIIVPKLSVADWGGARIDVAAITNSEIIGVEVKGEGDSPSRLPLQGLVYGRVARKMWLLPNEDIADKCFKQRPAHWGNLELWEGAVRPYNNATKTGKKIKTDYGHRWERLRDHNAYDPSEAQELKLLCPYSMCGTLWRDELFEVARLTQLKLPVRSPVHVITDTICAHLPAPTIHAAMIEQLRKRVWRKPIIDLRPSEEQPRSSGMGTLL